MWGVLWFSAGESVGGLIFAATGILQVATRVPRQAGLLAWTARNTDKTAGWWVVVVSGPGLLKDAQLLGSANMELRPERVMGLLRCLCNDRCLFDCSMLLLTSLLALSVGWFCWLLVYFLRRNLFGELFSRSCIDIL